MNGDMGLLVTIVAWICGSIFGYIICYVYGTRYTKEDAIRDLSQCEHEWETWAEPQQHYSKIIQFRCCSKCGAYDKRDV